MLDRSRTYGRSPGDLKPGRDDASADHYWLMRRTLRSVERATHWPQPLRLSALKPENAAHAHQLLRLGTQLGGGHVADFADWLPAFDTDPESDPQLCFIVESPKGVIAVAQCWTSAFIRNLVVHPDTQRQGVGQMLLAVIFQTFADRGEAHVDLKVMESNLAARLLYEGAGMLYVERGELEAS